MTKPTDNEFIQNFAKKWNEKLTKHTYSVSVNEPDTFDRKAKLYIGWMNLEVMLKVFLRAYKKKEKK